MPGKEGGKAKPLKAKVRLSMHTSLPPYNGGSLSLKAKRRRCTNITPQKVAAKDYSDEDKAHLQKKKEEAAAMKAARDALLKGKKK